MIKSKAKFFEFLTLFVMVVGTVVGSGIYMKNNELLTSTANPIIAIILWAIVGMVAVAMVYVFMEISSATKHFGNGTVANWTKLFIGRKTASFFSLIYLIVYIPSCQAVFTAGFITYLFQAMNVPLSVTEMFIIYTCVGISIIVIGLFVNMYAMNWSNRIQVFGTVFKFIPLLIALVAGFVIGAMNIEDGVFGNGNVGGATGEGDHPWSTSDFDGGLFLRGFGGILFSFDGFIYIANYQKTAKHKEVVPKALLIGMIFVAVLYILMAISLFMGSEDGSIQNMLAKLFNGGVMPEDASSTAAKVATILSNIILMIICVLGINIFSRIGVVGYDSDAKAKLIYSKNRNMNYARAGYTQMIFSVVVFVLFLTVGLLATNDSWKGVATEIPASSEDLSGYIGSVAGNMTKFIGIMSSTAPCLSFMMFTLLMIAGLRNRKTGKVKVDKIKGFVPIAIICSIFIAAFVGLGIFGFLVPMNVMYEMGGDPTVSWIKSDGPIFLLLFVLGIAATTIAHFIQEYKFKKDPFTDGFEGQID
ncbi:APC family permease [Mesoplasma photuris]|uniref:APC family permease n=1 Tax=Mesoplasma photuris TaxID=217731 RepID=UPI00068F56F9|nr:APC family permease [Mesoplasma photuris]